MRDLNVWRQCTKEHNALDGGNLMQTINITNMNTKHNQHPKCGRVVRDRVLGHMFNQDLCYHCIGL